MHIRAFRLARTRMTDARSTSSPPKIHCPIARDPALAMPATTGRRRGAQQTAHAASVAHAAFVSVLMDELVKVWGPLINDGHCILVKVTLRATGIL